MAGCTRFFLLQRFAVSLVLSDKYWALAAFTRLVSAVARPAVLRLVATRPPTHLSPLPAGFLRSAFVLQRSETEQQRRLVLPWFGSPVPRGAGLPVGPRAGVSGENAMPREIYLVRHGVCEDSHTMLGQSDPPLTEEGLAQAELLAKGLAQRGVERIVASPLQRAVQTAQAIADNTGIEI